MIEHKEWCDSLTKQLLSNPPKPAPCNCGVTKASNDTQQKLLPCPFCGSDAKSFSDWATCSNPECFVSDVAVVVDKWNKRVSLGSWISVDDRLPECGEYLVCCDTDDGQYVTAMEFNGKNWLIDGEPTYRASYYISPIHWMPLPPPPNV